MKEIIRECISRLSTACSMISAGQIAEMAGISKEIDISGILKELSSGPEAILYSYPVIFDANGEYGLEGDDLDHFNKTGEVVHPQTGELLKPGEVECTIYYGVEEASTPEPE